MRESVAAGDGDAGTKIQASLVAAEGGMEEEGREGRGTDATATFLVAFTPRSLAPSSMSLAYEAEVG